MDIKYYLNKTLVSKEGLKFRLYTTDGTLGNAIWKDLNSDTYYILPDFIIEQCKVLENNTISIY